ncbi:hypothetical protein LEM8419_03212 [Neolewinella maritima]|uniref:Glycosyltransferase RgtA/B/C/D-like domain-containing protein n=1 Tax=Neolewinella maritima TaxID=1383882 RepID=A0ABN8F9P9_9BACT|nr:glycosyltransferase family 39 protein [Neolewinella maritima]CAH1002292.1 hypothetical protein LEM8419_03212 [Neolewinella maritima]
MSSPTFCLRPVWLLLAWVLLNLLQAGLTPVDPDETYYWMYAGRLDWGYFDHPPAVALVVALGRDWLPGALGLRLGTVLVSAATVTAVYQLLDRPQGRDLLLAAALLFAQPFLQVYGFIATPDGPLLLFTALYLLAFRRFLRQPDWGSSLVWGLTMAGVLYTKYHGVLLIAFTVLPHMLYLLRQPAAWLAVVTGALLYVPHLYWQVVHDYPSFRYHLRGRDDAYQLKYTVQYVANQLLIFSPFLLYHYGRAFVQSRPADRFVRSCRWLIVGLLLFFLASTSKGGTEAHWTALLSIPLVYLTYTAARQWSPASRRMLLRLCWITGALLLIGRLALMAPREWLPFPKPFDNAPWVERLQQLTGEQPVIVENSYRISSLYEFYSGRPAWTFTDVAYRNNQYGLWDRDTAYQGRTVWLLGQGNWDSPTAQDFVPAKGMMRLQQVEDFQLAWRVELLPEVDLPQTVRTGQPFPVRILARAPFPLRLESELPLELYAILWYPDGEKVFWKLGPLETATLPADTVTPLYTGTVTIPPGTAPGEVQLAFGLAYRGMPPLRDQSVSLPLRLD